MIELLQRDTAIVLAAVVLDLVLGDPRALPHPVVAIGRMISFLEPPLRRLFPNERLAGVALLVTTVGVSYAGAALLLLAASAIAPDAGFVLGLYLAWVSLAARSLHVESGKVAKALERDDLPGARLALSYIVGRETEQLDETEIVRGAVETVA
ncbi:MAG TPA: CobD/CbiB family cobalamin biosynthesis protein, partial [Geomonas sp.]